MRSYRPRTGAKRLTVQQLFNLFNGVFAFGESDRRVAFFVDVPHDDIEDNESWRWLRETVVEWRWCFPKKGRQGIPLVDLLAYPAIGEDGAELPDEAVLWPSLDLPERMEDMPAWPRRVSIARALEDYDCAVFATRFSATQPLKKTVAERGLRLRAATMPGFLPGMMSALFIDYNEVARRVMIAKTLLDGAVAADLEFVVDGKKLNLHLDLRHYPRHASTGRLLHPGEVGNFPSGEAYVSPYDRPDSETAGWLPLQFSPNDEPVLYHVEHNRVMEVTGQSRRAETEQALIKDDPARGNIAELGLGVLHDMGVEMAGKITNPDKAILLLEKLGLHIAFGRNDGFGGSVKASDFVGRPIHRDHVFLPKYMPWIGVASVSLVMADGSNRVIMVDGHYINGLFD